MIVRASETDVDLVIYHRIILKDALTESPNWFSCYRDLTLCLSYKAEETEVVLETAWETRDMLQQLRHKGGLDYVDDIVFVEDKVFGTVISTEADKVRPTLVVVYLLPENMPAVYQRLAHYLA